jgi:uncharacterized protein
MSTSCEQRTFFDSRKIKYYIFDKLSQLFDKKPDSEYVDVLHATIIKSLESIKVSSVSTADIDQILFAAYRQMCSYSLNDIELFVTETCNCKCDYCFVRDKSPKSMSKDVALASVDYLLKESGKTKDLNITFIGGEPLLEFDLIKTVIEYVDSLKLPSEKKISYSLTTNGTIANHEIFSFFKGRFNLLLSIDGDKFSHNMHRTFTDGTATFDKIMANLELLKQYQPWLGTRMTVCPDNVNHLADNVKFLFKQGIRQFLIGLSYGSKWSPVSLLIYKEQMMNVLQFYIRLKKANEAIKIPLFEKETGEQKINNKIFGCRAGRNSLTVSPSGSLYPCSMMLGLTSLKNNTYCLGNIFDGITELHLRDDFLSLHCPDSGKCASCEYTGYCRGGCPAQNYCDTGSIDQPAKYTCEIAKINKSLVDAYVAATKELVTSNA